MTRHHDSGRHRVRAAEHSLTETLLAALAVVAVTVAAVVAVAATGVAVAFVAGAATAAVGHAVRRRTSGAVSTSLSRSAANRF